MTDEQAKKAIELLERAMGGYQTMTFLLNKLQPGILRHYSFRETHDEICDFLDTLKTEKAPAATRA